MNSYQLSERMAISDQRSAIRKDPSNKRNPSLLNADGFRWLKAISIIFFLLFLCSCGDEGLIDPHGETSLPPPNTIGRLHAIDFPTDTGSAWSYINIDTDEEFTLRVEGTRDVGGTTHRQMTVSEISPSDPDQFNWQAVDHLVANAFYLRFDTEFVDVFPFPIFATYFYKTPQALVESAFDIFLPDPPDGITIEHYKHFPPRRLWDFPLKVGKKWVVFEKTAGIPVEVTRYVAEKDVQVTVPAGSYTTYVVHEEAVYGDRPEPSSFLISPLAIYWVAPSIGVVQYRYSRYRATEELFSETFALKSFHLPGPNTD
ncbi:hypothetical protein F4054_01310 [Candidatus Poribacteria bacterium]|nr:hypothetical protein [Candidatus Poribacteria bacterium]MYG06423.1 hypothetical protein [Candidatus Poribacteria bacterium]MYK20878.1 hypothetical protein [Candidatus Poribacteria bacterium]